MQLANKNDALSADIFSEVVSFSSCFCSLFTLFYFWKILVACLLMQGAWSPRSDAVLKISLLWWIAGCHILYIVGLENVNHLLQGTCNLSRPSCYLPCVGSLRVFCCLIIGSSPLSKKLSRDIYFLLTVARLACGLMKGAVETGAWYIGASWERGRAVKVLAKILGGHMWTKTSVGF